MRVNTIVLHSTLLHYEQRSQTRPAKYTESIKNTKKKGISTHTHNKKEGNLNTHNKTRKSQLDNRIGCRPICPRGLFYLPAGIVFVFSCPSLNLGSLTPATRYCTAASARNNYQEGHECTVSSFLSLPTLNNIQTNTHTGMGWQLASGNARKGSHFKKQTHVIFYF